MKKNLLALFAGICAAASSFAQPVADFSGNPTTICAGKAVTWTNLSTGLTGGTNYTWLFPGATNNNSGSQNPGPRTYNTPGTYNVTLTVQNTNGTDTEVKTGYITVLAPPTVSVTPSSGNVGCTITSTTLVASGANTYVWSPATGLNTTTGSTVIASPTNNTFYTVTGTNASGCTDQQNVAVTVSTSAPPAPTGLAGPTTVCSGQSGVIFTVAGVTPPAPLRNWTVPPGATITAGQGTRSVTVTFGSTSGQICCNTYNACGASTPVCMNVTVDPTPAVGTVGTITGPTSVCDLQNGVVYTIAPVANALTYNWTENSDATIVSGQGTLTVTVDFLTNNNTNLCVTASNSCNTSAASCLAIVSTANPPNTPGTITGPTTVCSGQANVIYSVASVGGAATYSWTLPAGASITAGAGTRSITVTYGSSSGTVCVSAENGCGSSATNCIGVTVDPNPAVGTISTITGASAVCANQSLLTYSIPAVSGATTYNWTLPAGASITAGSNTNSITVTMGTTAGNICVDASNSCSSTSQECIAVSVAPNAPGIPGGITGLTTVCTGQSGVTYSVSSVPNTSTYNWTIPSGASITAGAGTNSITVSFGNTSGTVCVTASNSCGTSGSSCQAVTVDPTPAVGTVGTINGPTAVCANQSGLVYSVAPVTGATNYNWTLPAGASITAGAGTTTITVTFGSAAGDVCVNADNICSSSAQSCVTITVDPTPPGIPASITGTSNVCSGQAGEVYTTPSVANATVYNWSVPAGASITAGQGTNSITVTFGSTSGTVCVTAGNACGTSAPTCQTVSVSPTGVVGAIGSVSGPISACANQSNIVYSTVPVTNATTYNWTLPSGASITAGAGTATITVTFGANSGTVCVDASNSCSSTPQSCLAVDITAVAPTIPAAITGLTTVCSGQAGEIYTISPVAGATSYTWTAPTGGSITAGQGTTQATVTFGNTSGTMSVTASNACGTSMPATLAITVDPNPAVGPISTISGSTAACANQSNVVYTIPAVANATSYFWTVPSAANIVSGQGTNTITVTFGNVSGNICVGASNSCGTSPQSCIAVTVSPNAPAIPAGITGAISVCSGQVGPYFISPVTNATSYAWTVPTGASVTSGQGTTNTTITFGTTSGNICVSASNGCGTSNQNCLAVNVSASVLTVSTTVTDASNSTACDGSVTAAPAGGTGPFTYAWTPSGGVAATASGLCVGTYTVCVTDAAGCITCNPVTVSSPTGVLELTDNGTIKVFPNPANTYVMVEGTLSGSANMNISIINMFGQRMINETIHADGTFSQKVNIEGIPSGVYFIQVSAGELVRNSRIIKIN